MGYSADGLRIALMPKFAAELPVSLDANTRSKHTRNPMPTPPIPKRPESQWLYTLAPTSRILFMGERNSSTYAELRLASSTLSIPLEIHAPSEMDLRLRSLPREQFAAIYWEQKDALMPLEQAQRIFAMVFQALVPKSGRLVFTRESGQWDDTALESLLRQTAFYPEARWTGGHEKLWICRRV